MLQMEEPMTKWKAILIIALIFGAGVTLGISGTKMMVREAVNQTLTQPDQVRDRIERNLALRLRLDPVQRRRFHQVLIESRDEMQQVRRETQPRLIAIVSNAESRISTILGPEQQRQFDRLRAENRRVLPLGPLPPPILPPRGRGATQQ
jgi:Spy/CpxP family protein refolding chaperone